MRSPTASATTGDAESLFRTNPIPHLRSLESQTRREIDAKTLALRQLVGQSYRELIAAADSVLQMQSHSHSIHCNLVQISKSLDSLEKSPENIPSPSPSDPTRNRVHSIAARVKYLVDTPENIWAHLHHSLLLDAASRYLRAKEVYELIESNRDVISKFPLLKHQWQIVQSFRTQISQRSRERVCELGLTVSEYADALAAVSTIDQVEPRKVLGLFLDSRRNWVSQKLTGRAVSSSQVLVDVVRVVRDCLGQVGELFAVALSEMPLFYRVVLGSSVGTQVFGGIPNPEEEVRLWRLHRENLESVMVLMEPEYVAETCSSWLRSCCDEIFGELVGGMRLIDAIESGEGLGSAEKLVRVALDSREGLDESLDQWLRSVFGSDVESPWNQIRRFILKDGMNIFEDRLEEALVGRMKKIVHTEFENLNKDIQIRKAIESFGDEEGKSNGNQFEAYLNKPYNGSGVWFLDSNQKKTSLLHACKPTVEETDFCSCFNAYFGSEVCRIRDAVDNKCRNVLEDLLCFVECHNSTLRLKELAPYLQENCYSTISLLVKELERVLESLTASLENRITDKDSLLPSVIVERSLFIGRLLNALRSHSSYIPLILGSPRQWVKDTSSSMGNLLTSPSPRQTIKSFKSPVSFSPRRNAFVSPRSPKGQSFDNPRRQTISAAAALFSVDDSINLKLDELNKNLRELCIKAHSVWATWVANELSLALSRNLSRDETLSISTVLQGWDVTVVKQEESKEGPLEVTIALPSMPSLYITSFLFQACLEVHKVGGHILEKLIMQKLAWRLLQKILDVYEKFLAALEGGEAHVSEKGILQILFDLRFIADILSGGKDSVTSSLDMSVKEDSSRFSTLKSSFRRTISQVQTDSAHVESVTRLINRFSQWLDPIDWAMYEPYLWENEKQSYKRHAVLFGFLVQLNRLYTDTAQKLPTKSNTGSNIMRCSTVPRFKYLPISAPVLSSRGVQKSALHNLSDDASARSPWKAHSNGDQSPKTEYDESSNLGVAVPLLKSIMTVGSKFGESTSGWGSMLSDGQVGKFKDRSAAAMSTFGDILPGPAAGLFSSLTSGASRFNS